MTPGLSPRITTKTLARSLTVLVLACHLHQSKAANIVSASSLDGRSIGICFSDTLSSSTATNAGNYLLSATNVSVTSATLRPDGVSVQLTLIGTLSAPVLVGVTNLLTLGGDLVTNQPGPNVPYPCHVQGLTALDIGQPTPTGSTFSCYAGSLQTVAGGSGLGGTNDRIHFLYETWFHGDRSQV